MERYPNPPGGAPSDLDIVLRAKEQRVESSDCLSVLFQKPRGFAFAAGGWIDIRFLSPDLATGRTFSLSSSPTEPDLQITFKRGVSPFKERLQATKPGDLALITQHGTNNLVFDKRRPAVFIAGGVGIAPFRSMLKEAVDNRDRLAITLIYITRAADDAPFTGEIEIWKHDWPELTTHYVSTRRDGRVTRAMLEAFAGSAAEVAQSRFYVAGPPSMVASTETLLGQLAVPADQIRKDPFEGY